MRILLLTQYYWPENFLINSLVPLLVARGVEVTVLTGKPNYPDGLIFEGYRAGGCHREQHDGTIILRLPIVARGHRSRTRLALNYLSFIFSGIVFGRGLVGERGYDLVFVYAPSPLLQALPAIWLARSRQVPLVVWVQDLWPESLSATGSIKNQWLPAAVGPWCRCSSPTAGSTTSLSRGLAKCRQERALHFRRSWSTPRRSRRAACSNC